MESLVERQRQLHEEKDRLMDAITMELVPKRTSHRDQINTDHRIKDLLDRFQRCASDLRDGYRDNDGHLNDEISALGGPNVLDKFYASLKDVKSFHKDHPDEIAIPLSLEFEKMAQIRKNTTEHDDVDLVKFNDEEGFGRFFDLNECYEMYVNLKGIERVDYVTYLTKFDRLFEISREHKTSEYRKYVETLVKYLKDYCARAKPLLNLHESKQKFDDDFEKKWSTQTFPGWHKETESALTLTGSELDLTPFSSWEELASLGLDRLKFALMALGVKCGGPLEDRAKRLFSTKDKQRIEYDAGIIVNKGKRTLHVAQNRKEIMKIEAWIYRLIDILYEQKQATKDNVQSKQAQTVREREDVGTDSEDDELSDDEDEVVFNPKNVPLDWNGKPIPLWLYKLHGLNITYTCEICGNAVYKGPKAYQKHFSEPLHEHGMRCLGIPNTAHFSNIDKIEDAIALWNKLKKFNDVQRWKPERDEEFEDRQGNIMNKKTYYDLRRQGIL